MTNKELRRLRKTELMELLVDQMKQNEWLQKKLEGQETELKSSNSRLEEERQQYAEKTEQLAEKDRPLHLFAVDGIKIVVVESELKI